MRLRRLPDRAPPRSRGSDWQMRSADNHWACSAATMLAAAALLALAGACAAPDQPQGGSGALPAAHEDHDSAAAILQRLRGQRRSHGR